MRYSLPTGRDIHVLVETESATVEFLMQRGIIPREIACNICESSTTFYLERKQFRCKRTSCRKSQSCMTGTFFASHKTPTNKILEAAYFWLAKANNTQIETYTGIANTTVTSLVRYFRELIADSLDEVDLVIGGPGIVVEVDETKMGKRKYNRGHRVEGVWVLVGVERTSERKIFLRILPDRSAHTLNEMILQHVAGGSTIITDCWRGYNSLVSLGYTHMTVNHSTTFRDEVTGACTNTVEGTNNAIKMSIHPRQRTIECEDNLWEFIWRRTHQGNLWEAFVQALAEIKYE